MPEDQRVIWQVRRVGEERRVSARSSRTACGVGRAAGGPQHAAGPAHRHGRGRTAQCVVPASGELRHALVEPDLHRERRPDRPLLRARAALQDCVWSCGSAGVALLFCHPERRERMRPQRRISDSFARREAGSGLCNRVLHALHYSKKYADTPATTKHPIAISAAARKIDARNGGSITKNRTKPATSAITVATTATTRLTVRSCAIARLPSRRRPTTPLTPGR